MFTSGTVGNPKGVAVPHKALLSFIAYMKYAVDLRPEDKFWNMADPGWAYGLYFAVVGAPLVGVATHFYEGLFTVESTYKMLEKYGITVFCSAPTAYRLLMAAGDDLVDACETRIRVACSCGEPLNPEVIRWVNDHLDCPVHDQYGQTEVSVVVTNHHGLDHPTLPGSMGVSLARISRRDPRRLGPRARSRERRDALPSIPVRRRSTGFLATRGRSRRSKAPTTSPATWPRWTRTDASPSRDAMTTSSRRPATASVPFDVESCLIEHPAVAESGVVGKADAERGEIVVAFVVLHPDHEASPELARELQGHTRERLSAHAYPREVVFVDELPKTPSGKIRRYVLREQTK